ADFVAGHLELRDRENATIYLGARASAEFAFTPMSDGATVRLGTIRFEVLETPGHSPQSISILVHDPEHSTDAPSAVLTGDTLFIGNVGRPDLRASLGWSARPRPGLGGSASTRSPDTWSGMQRLDDAPHLVERIEWITAGSLAEQLASSEPFCAADAYQTSPRSWAASRHGSRRHSDLSRL